MRKIHLLPAAVIASALLLSGCSANTPTAPESPGKASGEITYGLWGENQLPAMKEIVAAFNKEYPDVTVNLELTPWAQYWTKLQTQASSKTLPDVFWMNGPNVRLYADNGMLAPIKDLVDTGNYPKAMNELYSVKGVQYAVPKDFDTVALWYNSELFEKAGLPVPTDDWDWNDFTKAAASITDALGASGVYGATAELLSLGQGSYYNSILQAGGEIISADGKKSGFDSPQAIRGLELWTDLIANGDMPTIQQMADAPAVTWFTSGKAAMFWSGTWSVRPISESDVADTATVVPLPKGERRATVIHGIGNVMSAHSDNPTAASAFLAFLGSKEANLIQAKSGTANPAFLGTQQAFVDSQPSFNLQVFEDAAEEYAFPYPISGNTSVWNEIEKELLPQAFSGQRPVAEVASELAKRMNEALAEEQ